MTGTRGPSEHAGQGATGTAGLKWFRLAVALIAAGTWIGSAVAGDFYLRAGAGLDRPGEAAFTSEDDGDRAGRESDRCRLDADGGVPQDVAATHGARGRGLPREPALLARSAANSGLRLRKRHPPAPAPGRPWPTTGA